MPKIQFPSLQMSTFGKIKGCRYSNIRFDAQPVQTLLLLLLLLLLRYRLVILLGHVKPAKLCFPLRGKICTFGHDNIDSNQWNPSNDRQKIEEVGNKETKLRKIEQKRKKKKN